MFSTWDVAQLKAHKGLKKKPNTLGFIHKKRGYVSNKHTFYRYDLTPGYKLKREVGEFRNF